MIGDFTINLYQRARHHLAYYSNRPSISSFNFSIARVSCLRRLSQSP